MEENRFNITGVVVGIEDVDIKSPFFKIRTFKIRFSDTDFTGKAVDRIIKFAAYNDEIAMLDHVMLDDVVQVHFYLDGRDVIKDDKVFNFTNLIMKRIDIINSVSRTTQESREALITKEGLVYDNSKEEATIEDLMGIPKTEEVKVTTKSNEFSDLPF